MSLRESAAPLPLLPSPLRLELPDVECADISRYFNQVYEYVEDARAKGEGEWANVGVSGRGVSRGGVNGLGEWRAGRDKW